MEERGSARYFTEIDCMPFLGLVKKVLGRKSLKKINMSEEEKKTYSLSLEVNGYSFKKVDISQHYKEKHSDINDELILELLKLFVDKKDFQPDKLTTDYFVLEKILYQDKKYKLVWQIENGKTFIIVNCYRIRKKW
jgi:hypothetical protein